MKRPSRESRRPGRGGSSTGKPSGSVGSSVPSASASADAEPWVARRWMPVWLILLFGLLFYWGQLYLDSNAAGFDPRVYEPFHSFAEVESLRPKGGAELILAKGKAQFELRCAICHEVTGQGKPGIAPPLALSEWVNTPGPGRIGRIALHGLKDPIEVKGQQYDLNMTPGLAAGLSPEDFAALLSYVRQSWGNTAPIVTPEQAKSIQDKVADRPTMQQWTASE